jgi:hypothetical protein
MRQRAFAAWRRLGAVVAAAAMATTAQAQLGDIVGGDGAWPPPPWRLRSLPRQTQALTRFSRVELDGQLALRVQADASYGYLVHALAPGTGARWLSWRWRVDEANARADLRTRDGDDAALKVCVSFELPLDAVPFVERQLLRLARSRSGDALPAATLCYVWDPHLAGGSLLDNAYSRRVRWLVLRGAGSPLSTWQSERRDLQADFLRAFGDESRSVPPLLAIAVGADADNTRGRSLAYLTDLRLQP